MKIIHIVSIPIIIMWIYRSHKMNNISLSFFSVFFGLFLIFSITLNLKIHILTVIIFCISAIIHFNNFIKYHNLNKNFYIFLIISSLSLVILSILQGIFLKNFKDNKNNKESKNYLLINTYWFWIFESIGLTSLILFMPIYLLTR